MSSSDKMPNLMEVDETLPLRRSASTAVGGSSSSSDTRFPLQRSHTEVTPSVAKKERARPRQLRFASPKDDEDEELKKTFPKTPIPILKDDEKTTAAKKVEIYMRNKLDKVVRPLKISFKDGGGPKTQEEGQEERKQSRCAYPKSPGVKPMINPEHHHKRNRNKLTIHLPPKSIPWMRQPAIALKGEDVLGEEEGGDDPSSSDEEDDAVTEEGGQSVDGGASSSDVATVAEEARSVDDTPSSSDKFSAKSLSGPSWTVEQQLDWIRRSRALQSPRYRYAEGAEIGIGLGISDNQPQVFVVVDRDLSPIAPASTIPPYRDNFTGDSANTAADWRRQYEVDLEQVRFDARSAKAMATRAVIAAGGLAVIVIASMLVWLAPGLVTIWK